MVDSSLQIPHTMATIEESADFDWAVAPIPHTTEEPRQNSFGASLSIPTSTPEKELAAWLFIKHFTTNEAQAKWAQATNYLPVRVGAGEYLIDTFDNIPAYKIAFELLPYSITEPSVPGYDFVRDEIELALAAVLEGTDIAATLNSLNATANLILVIHTER
jgi:multiple sugar transport system substrate-binding protein/sn-glycerol 3-phosphate transport system substrate-binding protein